MMEVKKKEHLKLEKNSGLYFAIGMTLILALVYTALEWKTFDNSENIIFCELNPPDSIDEDVPVTFHYIKPPPPVIPTVIEIAPDDPEIIETVIEAIDPNQDTEIISCSFNIEDPDPDIDEVPFMVIEDVPVFPGCEGTDDKRACFQEKMQKHIRKNFRYPEEAQEMGLQGKVYLQFTVQKDGSIGGLKMRGPHQILESEASRIISKLPKMEPGKQRGQAVKVPFSIPITFKLQ
ncbi:energy transducer TonB [uncultured Croceitalea sp.]|uniref:energy transducer TonB n=1 Tax=uncultured Croceitalea sp. TaxID=1798908 RepID=UPI00374F3712